LPKLITENYEITELDNGIRIVSEYIPYFRSISLGIWVASGSRNEAKQLAGISHLIEHLLFKGTKNRTNKEIAIEFDSVGADFNAFTDKEVSCFYCDFIDTHLEKCGELLFDIVFNPLFNPESLRTEKKIIMEEIKMVQDTPSEDIFNYFYKEVLDGHSLSLPILGSKESLLRINEKDVWDYFKETFTFKNVVISAAGNVKHKDLIEVVKKNIENLQVFSSISNSKKVYFRPRIKRNIKIVGRKIKSSNLCYGGIGCARLSNDKFALSVLQNIIGGSMSSRLFQKIREDNGLAYSIFASNAQYSDIGVIYIYAASDSKNLGTIINMIENEINDIRVNGVTQIELERAKENMKGGIVLNIEEISSRMCRFGKNLLLDNYILSINDILNKIDTVSKEKVQEICIKYYDPGQMNIVILGEANERSLR